MREKATGQPVAFCESITVGREVVVAVALGLTHTVQTADDGKCQSDAVHDHHCHNDPLFLWFLWYCVPQENKIYK
mgnify:CR=1 FL=1